MLQLFARLGKPRDAENVIREMQNAYLRPNVRTYGIIMNAWIAAGQIEEALPLLERMRMEGIPPTVSVFNHLVKGYSEAMQPDGVDRVSHYNLTSEGAIGGHSILQVWCCI